MYFKLAGLRLAALGFFVCVTSVAFADDMTIAGTAPGGVNAGDLFDFHPQATAVGSLFPYFEIQNAPPWASFEPYDGRLSGVPSAGDVGTYSGITISITDGQSSIALPAFSIVVRAADGSLGQLLTWIAPTQNVDASPLTDLAAYYIYEGATPDSLVPIAVADPASSSLVLGNLGAGPHYFAITTLNSSAVESTMSAVVCDSVIPVP